MAEHVTSPPVTPRTVQREAAARGFAKQQHGDVLVLGTSLAAALSATILARRGAKVIWAGRAPPPRAPLDDTEVHRAPGLFPSLSLTPALSQALSEVGLLADVQHQLRPVSVQLIGADRRLTLPADEERLGATKDLAALRNLAEQRIRYAPPPLRLGVFARRAFLRARAAMPPVHPQGIARELVEPLELFFGAGTDAYEAALPIAAAPHDLPGGTFTLVTLLREKFVAFGGTLAAGAIDHPVARLDAGWRSVRCVFDGGAEASARVLMLGLDADERARLLGKKAARYANGNQGARPRPLLRLSLIVRSRGLPPPLGTHAFVSGDTPFLIERRPLPGDRDEIGLYWRDDATPVDGQAAQVFGAFVRTLPFVDRHVVARAPAQAVPGTERAEHDRQVRPGRAVLEAQLPVFGLEGVEGAALLSPGLVDLVQRLAPRTVRP